MRKLQKIEGPDKEFILATVMSTMNELETHSEQLDRMRKSLNLILREYGVRLPRYEVAKEA